MTREEAIRWLEIEKSIIDEVPEKPQGARELKEAYDMAIEALQADTVPIEKYHELQHQFVMLGAAFADADRPQWEWIPCSERLPEDLEAVNVTWVNHNPPVYYQYTKDVPNADTAVYYRGAWYWWDATVIDLLGEYGGAYNGVEPIDKDVEVIAWMPLPKPYKGGDTE